MTYLKHLLTGAAAALLAAVPLSAQKFDKLAQTPPMGWNSWNTFASNIDENLVKGIADTMEKNGMKAAGYEYIVIDDCWMTKDRDKDGNLVADPAKFPHGMKALAKYVHDKGFKFGLYNCAGSQTCAGFPGGMGHEYQDARIYASFDIDYLKYDWCSTGTRNAQEAYTTMRDALYSAGRPIVFSMCEWGTSKPWNWAKDTGHLWRTTGDIYACYDCKTRWSSGWKVIADFQATNTELINAAGPGHWNDPDMLEVGVGNMTLAENRAHFSIWCMMAAPLIAGNDIRSMKPEILQILTNKEVIAVDQDKLGKQGFRWYGDSIYEIWLKPLSDGDLAVCVMNVTEQERDISITWANIGEVPKKAAVRDLWEHKDLGSVADMPTFSRKIGPHDVAMLRFTVEKPAK